MQQRSTEQLSNEPTPDSRVAELQIKEDVLGQIAEDPGMLHNAILEEFLVELSGADLTEALFLEIGVNAVNKALVQFGLDPVYEVEDCQHFIDMANHVAAHEIINWKATDHSQEEFEQLVNFSFNFGTITLDEHTALISDIAAVFSGESPEKVSANRESAIAQSSIVYGVRDIMNSSFEFWTNRGASGETKVGPEGPQRSLNDGSKIILADGLGALLGGLAGGIAGGGPGCFVGSTICGTFLSVAMSEGLDNVGGSMDGGGGIGDGGTGGNGFGDNCTTFCDGFDPSPPSR